MFCPECGQQNKENNNFCQHCGASLSTSRSTVVRRSRRKALLISIVAIVVILSSVIYFLFTREKGIYGTYISSDPQRGPEVFIELKGDNTVVLGTFLKWKLKANKIVIFTPIETVEVSIEGDRITGPEGSSPKRDGAKPIKSSQGRLWSAYFDQRTGSLFEFREDGIVKAGILGKYESKGNTLTVHLGPKGKEETTKGKIENNKIVLGEKVFVKYSK